MKRFYLNQPLGKDFQFTGQEQNHLAHVLRAKVGEDITICNGDEFDYVYQVEKIAKDRSNLKFLSREVNKFNPSTQTTVFLAYIKHENISLAVEKLNEIGATELVLFNAARSNIPSNQIKLEKLNKIAEQSCKQCGRSKPLSVRNGAISEAAKFGTVLFADEAAAGKTLTKWSCSGDTAVIVGPEGGFTDAERTEILNMPNVTPVSLGKRILRAETAAIVATALVLFNAGAL